MEASTPVRGEPSAPTASIASSNLIGTSTPITQPLVISKWIVLEEGGGRTTELVPQVAAFFGILQLLVLELLPQHAVYSIAASSGYANAVKKRTEHQWRECTWSITTSARVFQVRVLQESLTSRISSQDDFVALAIVAG
jgi:hypothetical protein